MIGCDHTGSENQVEVKAQMRQHKDPDIQNCPNICQDSKFHTSIVDGSSRWVVPKGNGQI